MSLKPLAALLRNFISTGLTAARIEKEAQKIIKEAGIPPALFRIRTRGTTLRIQTTHAQARSEIFIHQKEILLRLKERFGDRAPTMIRF